MRPALNELAVRLGPLVMVALALALIGFGTLDIFGRGPACLVVGALIWFDLFVGDAIETWRQK